MIDREIDISISQEIDGDGREIKRNVEREINRLRAREIDGVHRGKKRNQ